MALIRKTLAESRATITRNDLRRSAFDKRRIMSAAEELEQRERDSYAASELDHMDFARNERGVVQFDETQIMAQELFCTQQFAVMAGFAGTGKTTNMAGVLPRWKDQVPLIDWANARSAGTKPSGVRTHPAIALCCFTNVAAKNLAAKLPGEWSHHCMSIHSMLAFAPVDLDTVNIDTGRAKVRFMPRYNRTNKLPYKIIAIDEAGIVSRELWQNILDACEPDTRIYFLGDLAQLPAIQGVSPMPFAIDKWPTVVLDKIYRQKGDSQIIPNLTHIRKGMLPKHSPADFRCGKQETLDQNALAARRHIQAYINLLHKMQEWDPIQDIILTPLNDGVLGQRIWNSAFRFQFNPDRHDAAGKLLNPVILIKTATGPISLRIGDKVMATDNGGRLSTEVRFNNGSIGVVSAIAPNPDFKGDMAGYGEIGVNHVDSEDKVQDMMDLFTEVKGAEAAAMSDFQAVFDQIQESEDEDIRERQASHIVTITELATGDEYILTRSAEISTLQHAYAATCHKFQGSQARHVIVISHTTMPFGLNREWLYTACSRAQKKVFLLHDRQALIKSVQQQQIKGSSPMEKANNLRELYEKRPWARPIIPSPRRIEVD